MDSLYKDSGSKRFHSDSEDESGQLAFVVNENPDELEDEDEREAHTFLLGGTS
jgi:hypothetical protein